MNTQKRMEEFKVKLLELTQKYETNLVAVPTFVPSDSGYKIGAVINVIDKKDYGNKIQEVSE